MSAAELRQAAVTLRERAKAATPGPWFPWDGWGPTRDDLMGFARFGPSSGERIFHHDEQRDLFARRADVEYIATMHPRVGLALADWLKDTAEQFELIETEDWDRHHRWADPAFAVARAINGGPS